MKTESKRDPRIRPLDGDAPLYMLDRILKDVEHGRFERSMAGITAAGSVVTAGEIWLEHDKASFGNKMMWAPIAVTPLVALAGVGGVFSRRWAKTVLPLTSALLVANGIQGTYLHLRGVAQRPGGLRHARFNLETGPPLFAPLLVTMVGGMGLLAAVLRREQ
ncbi:MAG: hypothetical protein WBF71_08390 [Microthrixaceae bacterium]